MNDSAINHSNIVKFCSSEVHKQLAPATEVSWMYEAYFFAKNNLPKHPTPQKTTLILSIIKTIGWLVDPHDNNGSWRKSEVCSKDYKPFPRCVEVPMLMSKWAMNLESMTQDEAYKEFEEIHPFVDGNGRVGAILYNWLMGWPTVPAVPPNFWP